MANDRSSANGRVIAAFFFLTFAIGWGILLSLGLFAPQHFNIGTALLAGWSPTLAAVLLTRLREGKAGLHAFVSRIFKWRVGLQWWLFVLFSTAAIAYAAIGVSTLTGHPWPASNMADITTHLPPLLGQQPWLLVPLIFVVSIFAGGPLAEDIGWRGYILPQLREHMNALPAGLLIGVVWAIWHLPFFWFPEARSIVGGMPFIPFALLTTAMSVLMAWVFVNTGSILMPVLYHAAMNTTLGWFSVLGQGAGDLTPLYLDIAVTWIVVGIVVVIFGTDLVRRPRPEATEILRPRLSR